MSEIEIQAAVSRREQQEAALYRSDGTKIFGEREHAERMAAIRAEHSRAFDQIDADVELRVQEAEEQLLRAEHADPSTSLRTDELQRASALDAFVGAEVQDLPTQTLVQRLRAAAASGDKARMFALARHAARRQDEDLTGQIREAVAEVHAKLAPDQERELAEAREAHEEAQALRERAYLARRGAKDAADLYFSGGTGSGYWGAAS